MRSIIMNKNSKPIVSIVMITYNHEKYIAQAINGIFIQNTSFPIEIIIADDNSPDLTENVINELIKTAPENITIVYTKHKENKGMIKNFVWALQHASGKYIALCEGDDYWTDSQKLQKQIDFLEQNEEYILCFSNRDILDDGVIKINEPIYKKTSFDKSEIANVYVPTLTAVFRNVVSDIPQKLQHHLIDCSLFLFLSQFGKFYYMDISTAVYRVHDLGVYSGSSDLINKTRSVGARIAAWFSLENIDKITLAHTISYLINQKKEVEIRDKHYLSALNSIFYGYFFDLYILLNLLKNKVQKLF